MQRLLQNPPSLLHPFKKSSLSDHLVSVLTSSPHPIEVERPLSRLSPLLTRHSLNSALQSPELTKHPRLCFRLFIWAASIPRLRSGFSQKLILDMLLSSFGNGNGNGNGGFDLYWSVIDEVRKEGRPVSADVFVVVILGYWRMNKAEKAVEAFGRMREYECKPNLAAYNVILNVLVKKNVILLALAVYNVMLKSNCRLGADTYSVLIDGLCKSGMTEDALRLFDEMSKRGILPNRITYTVVICGLCAARRVEDARRLFGLMRSGGCKPDSATYNALLGGFCKFGRVDEALALLKSFRDEGFYIGLRGFSVLIDGLVKAKRMSEAEQVFETLVEEDLEPDVVLYTIMMRGLCEAGRMEDAMSMFREMVGRGVLPDTRAYNVLIKGFCDAGFLDRARSLKLEISQHDQFPNAHTYTILICGLCKNGMVDEAEQIFDDMEKHGCLPSAVTFNAMIDGLCKAGKLQEAHLKLYKMEIGKNPSLFLRLSQGADRVLDSASLQKMVENLVESGLILKAYKLLMQLVDDGVVPDIKTYNTLINGMCKEGKIDSAFKLFEELQLKGNRPDSITYATLIEGLQREGREGDAFKLFERMNKNGIKPGESVYKSLMTWSCRRNNLSVASDIWLKYIRSQSAQEREAINSIEEYFKRGEFEKAVRSLLEVNTKSAGFDSASYSIWLIGLCQTNKVDEALNTFSILKEFNVSVSAPGCVKLIDALCCVERLEEAVEIFHYAMEKGYRLMPRIYNALLEALLSSKDTEMLAFEVIEKMKSSRYYLNSHLLQSTKSLLDSQQCSFSKVENA